MKKHNQRPWVIDKDQTGRGEIRLHENNPLVLFGFHGSLYAAVCKREINIPADHAGTYFAVLKIENSVYGFGIIVILCKILKGVT